MLCSSLITNAIYRKIFGNFSNSSTKTALARLFSNIIDRFDKCTNFDKFTRGSFTTNTFYDRLQTRSFKSTESNTCDQSH
ncbi:hypothetical protein HZH66_002898 [Vespula vulgaris]|uniref:Uncharacterized protein n=1 Tax=Vespula vulgaris TaxID=7454 RepID=A0A834KQK1_VESVU|nr:hypothetical protein HZH66_002898 [Vespula vulgaris]